MKYLILGWLAGVAFVIAAAHRPSVPVDIVDQDDDDDHEPMLAVIRQSLDRERTRIEAERILRRAFPS